MDQSAYLAPGVRRLTVNVDHDDVGLFEGLWAVPDGVALHAYLVEGDRKVVVDPWDAGGYGVEELGEDLAALGLGWKDIDAVASTRPLSAEGVTQIRTLAPRAQILAPGGPYDLGAGLSLESGPGLWWVPSVGAVFSGDAFAGLGWVEDEVWAEDLEPDAARYFDDEALRWFATRPLVPVLPDQTRFVFPAHGLATKTPAAFVERAQRFARWAGPDALDEVTVVWPDGADGVDALVGGALDAGVGLNVFRVPGDDRSSLAAGARRASLVVVAEGLDDGFLRGLDKDVWRPKVTTAPADLRAGLRDRF